MLVNFNDFLKNQIGLLDSYIIANFSDFNNENKINFYYNLFNYILKNSIYIYQIP